MSSDQDLGALLLLSAAVLQKKRKKRKRRWSKEWFKMRNRFSHEHLLSLLRETEPEDYKNFLRMDDASYDMLLELVQPKIERKDTVMREAIPPNQRLSITLRYLSTGMDMEDLKFMCAIAPQTLQLIIMETCTAIIEALKDNIQVPKTEEAWKQVAQDFENRWNFHNCLVSVDGKHVSIQKPAHSGSYYYNYKRHFSIVLMAIVNANYEFMMIHVGANGLVSDGGVFKNTLFWRKLTSNQLNIPDSRVLPGSNSECPYVFIGDEAFQLLPNFMKPYNRAVLTDEKRVFNYRLSRARRVMENVFGILTRRFKIFQGEIKFEPPKARNIIMACCHLHNYLCRSNGQNYLQYQDIDHENASSTTELRKTRAISTSSVEKKRVREEFRKFFNTCGAVPWQNECQN